MSRRIFISYSSHDVQQAEDLERTLRTEEFDVWRDKRDIETDWSAEIAAALTDRADALCLVWSESAAHSQWVQNEWLTARAVEKLIVPWVLAEAPPLPAPLVNLTWAPHADRVGFMKMLNARSPAYDYTIVGPNVHIPYNPSPNFHGRKQDLADLYRQLIGNLNKIGINQVGAVGMGGIGKTQLTVEFACRFSFAFDAIFWIDAADSNKWLPQIVEIARDRLKLAVAEAAGVETTRQYILAFQNYCREHPRTLLVMDNVQDPALLNSEGQFFGVAALSLGCNLLFTTRSHFNLPGVAEHPVDILTLEASSALLQGMRPQADASERHSADLICQALGNLPLALVLVGSFLRKKPGISYAAYYEGLKERGLPAIELNKVKSEELATRHKGAVSDVLREQLALVDNGDSLLLFKLAGQLPENAIVPKARLGLLAGLENKSVFEQALDDAFLLLEQLSLAEPMENGSAVRLHPLVRDFAYRLVEDPGRGPFLTEAARRVASAYALPERLEREYASRGIDAVVEDLHIAAGWLQSEKAEASEVTMLERVLDRERHHLRQEAHFFQQLHHRAFGMGLESLAERFLRAAKKPVLRSRGVSRREDAGLIRTLEGHTRGVSWLAISPDGRRALSAASDASMILWDLTTGAAIRQFVGHRVFGESVYASVTSDWQRAMSVQDRLVIMWDINTGRSLGAWEMPPETVPGIAQPEGIPPELWKPKEEPAQLSCVALSENGNHAVVGYGSKLLLLVPDLANGGLAITPFEGHSLPVTGVCLYPGGRYVLTGSKDKTLIFWDLELKQGRRLEGLTGDVLGLSTNADGTLALCSSLFDGVVLWDMRQGTILRRFDKLGNFYFHAVCLSADGRRALASCSNNIVYLWDAESGKELRRFEEHTESVFSVCLSGNGRYALSGSMHLMLWATEL